MHTGPGLVSRYSNSLDGPRIESRWGGGDQSLSLPSFHVCRRILSSLILCEMSSFSHDLSNCPLNTQRMVLEILHDPVATDVTREV